MKTCLWWMCACVWVCANLQMQLFWQHKHPGLHLFCHFDVFQVTGNRFIPAQCLWPLRQKGLLPLCAAGFQPKGWVVSSPFPLFIVFGCLNKHIWCFPYYCWLARTKFWRFPLTPHTLLPSIASSQGIIFVPANLTRCTPTTRTKHVIITFQQKSTS